MIISCSRNNSDKNEASTGSAENSVEVIKAAVAPEKWTLNEDVDKLTGKRTTYLFHSSKISIPKSPEGTVEIKVTCVPYESNLNSTSTTPSGQMYKHISIIGNIPKIRLAIYETPQLFVSQGKNLFGESYTYSKFRSVLQDGTQDDVFLIQAEFSNVFEDKDSITRRYRELITNLKLDEEIFNDNTSINKEIKAALNPKELKKLELKFNEGTIHVIDFDSNYLKFTDSCTNFMKK